MGSGNVELWGVQSSNEGGFTVEEFPDATSAQEALKLGRLSYPWPDELSVVHAERTPWVPRDEPTTPPPGLAEALEALCEVLTRDGVTRADVLTLRTELEDTLAGVHLLDEPDTPAADVHLEPDLPTGAREASHAGMDDLRRRTDDLSQTSTSAQLLGKLLASGISLGHLSTLTGMHPRALSPVRAAATLDQHHNLAAVLALLGVIAEHGHDDPVAWLETSLPGAHVRPLDLALADRHELILALLGHHGPTLATSQVLDTFDARWRERHLDRDWETFVAGDGITSIRPTSR